MTHNNDVRVQNRLYSLWVWWIFASVVGGILAENVVFYIQLWFLHVFGIVGPVDVNVLVIQPITSLIGGAVGGAIGGLLHWLLVRHTFNHALWWTMKCTLGGAIIFSIIYIYGYSFYTLFKHAPVGYVYSRIGSILSPIIGIVLFWILRDTRPAQ